MGVVVMPGCTELTRMFSGAYCTAAVLVMIRTAPLLPWYAVAEALAERLAFAVEHVAQYDPRALLYEEARLAGADSARRARDQRDLVCEPSAHGQPLAPSGLQRLVPTLHPLTR